jgi:hypothetical protein
MGLGYSTTLRLLTPASSRLKPVPQKHRMQAAKLVSPTRDAERPGMHTHAERGHDRAPNTPCGTGFSREAPDLLLICS